MARDRVRRAVLQYETLEHEHAKQGYELDRVYREVERLKVRITRLLDLTPEEIGVLLELISEHDPFLVSMTKKMRRSLTGKLEIALTRE